MWIRFLQGSGKRILVEFSEMPNLILHHCRDSHTFVTLIKHALAACCTAHQNDKLGFAAPSFPTIAILFPYFFPHRRIAFIKVFQCV